MAQISLKAEYTEINDQWSENLLFWIKELYQIYKDEFIETVALRNLSMKIYRGEFISILGPSGSGKTSLLKIIAGLLPCTTGRIYFKATPKSNLENIAKYNSEARITYRRDNIGYISQELVLFDYLTVEENIQIPLLIKDQNPKENEDEIEKIMKDCGIEHRREYKIQQLSGGEKQRVQIAMALITKPRIILADEPTANLDSKNALNIFDLLKQINNKYQSNILAVTHDVSIKSFTHRNLIIKDGELFEENK